MLTAEDRDSLRTRISELCVLKFGARYECCFWELFPLATLPAPTPIDVGESGVMSWASVMLGERPVTLAPVSMRYCLLCAEDAAPKRIEKSAKLHRFGPLTTVSLLLGRLQLHLVSAIGRSVARG